MKYKVHMIVDAGLDIDVDAESIEDAYDKASETFWDLDKTSLNDLEILGAKPAFIMDDSGEIIREY